MSHIPLFKMKLILSLWIVQVLLSSDLLSGISKPRTLLLYIAAPDSHQFKYSLDMDHSSDPFLPPPLWILFSVTTFC
ncbi:hypothetical protein B0J14DRAFT_592741 [Halenospora varia]|nr:hypothetical protein B0J14DRAFT_592741 [Halenospora varia]